MVTKTKPRRPVRVLRSAVSLSRSHAARIGRLLGYGEESERAVVLARLCELLSDQQAAIRGAPVAPLRSHLIAELENVVQASRKFYDALAQTTDPAKGLMPDLTVVLHAVATFHDDTAVVLLQMRGRPSQRGGAKRSNIRRTRETAKHAIGVFWDLNARDTNGTPVSESARKSGKTYWRERAEFVEYCMDLITPGNG